MQLSEEGLRRRTPSANQHQRVILRIFCRTLDFSSQMVLGGREHKDSTDQPAEQTHLLEQVVIDVITHKRGDLVRYQNAVD